MGVDLHQVGTRHYFTLVDKASGYRVCYPIRNMTATTVIDKMETFCHTFGVPVKILSDNGPCFRSAWRTWCDKMGIKHQTSSPLNPRSNGLSEAGVKVVKAFQKKSGCGDKQLQEYIFRLNNIRRADNTGSPAEIFFRRRTRCGFPNISKTECDFKRLQEMRQALVNRRNRKMEKHYSHSEYRPGDLVRVQDQKTLRWSTSATVMEKRRDPEGKTSDSYYVKDDDNGMLLRSGRFLKIKKDHARGVILNLCSRLTVASGVKVKLILKRKCKVGFLGLSPVPDE